MWLEKAKTRAKEIELSENKLKNLKLSISELPKIPTLAQFKDFLKIVKEILGDIS